MRVRLQPFISWPPAMPSHVTASCCAQPKQTCCLAMPSGTVDMWQSPCLRPTSACMHNAAAHIPLMPAHAPCHDGRGMPSSCAGMPLYGRPWRASTVHSQAGRVHAWLRGAQARPPPCQAHAMRRQAGAQQLVGSTHQAVLPKLLFLASHHLSGLHETRGASIVQRSCRGCGGASRPQALRHGPARAAQGGQQSSSADKRSRKRERGNNGSREGEQSGVTLGGRAGRRMFSLRHSLHLSYTTTHEGCARGAGMRAQCSSLWLPCSSSCSSCSRCAAGPYCSSCGGAAQGRRPGERNSRDRRRRAEQLAVAGSWVLPASAPPCGASQMPPCLPMAAAAAAACSERERPTGMQTASSDQGRRKRSSWVLASPQSGQSHGRSGRTPRTCTQIMQGGSQ